MKICRQWCAALALAAGLAGCAGGAATTEGGSGSGVTVFGTVDAGVSRVR